VLATIHAYKGQGAGKMLVQWGCDQADKAGVEVFVITPKRNQLEEDIIEAYECLKAWWRNSLIEQQFGHFKKQKQ
jgi:hypothetical protein